MTIGSGPTVTGTYAHYCGIKPLSTGVTVTAAF
jgi:hypothetical protein